MIFRSYLAIVIGVLLFTRQVDAQSPSRSNGMDLIWSQPIEKLANEPAGWMAVDRHATEAVAFSPDTKLLAITLAHGFHVFGSSEHENTHLLLVNVENPTNVTQYDLGGTCGIDLSWNSVGDALLICGKLLRLRDSAVCSVGLLPNRLERSSQPAFWLDAEHVIRWSGVILDSSCTETSAWPVKQGWRIDSAAPSRDRLLLSHFVFSDSAHEPHCEAAIYERISGRPLDGWPKPKESCISPLMLSQNGATLCANFGLGRSVDHQKLQCWDPDGAREIPVPKQLRHYQLHQMAAMSGGVLVDQWKYPWYDLSPPLLTQRAVFDVRTGKIAAAWQPRMQRSGAHSVPYSCALSAHAEYVAESGDGLLELYRLAQ